MFEFISLLILSFSAAILCGYLTKRFLVFRFIAGSKVEDALRAAKKLNGKGLGVILNILGEAVHPVRDKSLSGLKDTKAAQNAVIEYLNLLNIITKEGLRARVSVKLSQLGLDIDEKHCLENLECIIREAKKLGVFVWVDMESSDYTTRTIQAVYCLSRRFNNIGIAIQANLFRSQRDAQRLNSALVPIRFCKGAYKENPAIAWQKRELVTKNLISLLREGVVSENYIALATQDESVLDKMRDLVDEIQMLYGVRQKLQQELVQETYNVWIYVPFGLGWKPYVMRRMREWKTVEFILREVLRR